MKTPKNLFVVLNNDDVRNLTDGNGVSVCAELTLAQAQETAKDCVSPENLLKEELDEGATQTVYELVPVFRAHRAARPKFSPVVKTTDLRKNKK